MFEKKKINWYTNVGYSYNGFDNNIIVNNHQYLELNALTDRELKPGPFDLEPTVLTIIPQCFGPIAKLYIAKILEW